MADSSAEANGDCVAATFFVVAGFLLASFFVVAVLVAVAFAPFVLRELVLVFFLASVAVVDSFFVLGFVALVACLEPLLFAVPLDFAVPLLFAVPLDFVEPLGFVADVVFEAGLAALFFVPLVAVLEA